MVGLSHEHARDAVRWKTDDDGVVFVVIDQPGAAANMINEPYIAGMTSMLDSVQDAQITGIVITSAKPSFFSGPDFALSDVPVSDGGAYEHVVEVRELLRRLETVGRPVAAALVGSALGGGFELALACHYRVGLDQPGVRWALAERATGILPAGGGTVRCARMLGVATTVRETVGGAIACTPAMALARGLVDELADSRVDVEAAAHRWVLKADARDSVQRWERRGYQIPGGVPGDPSFEREMSALGVELDRHQDDPTYPAARSVLEVAISAVSEPIEDAFELETSAYQRLTSTPLGPQPAQTFAAIKRLYDRVVAAQSPGGRVPDTLRTFALPHRSPLVDAFLPAVPNRLVEVALDRDAPEREIVEAIGIASLLGIPVITHAHDRSVLSGLLAGLSPDTDLIDPLDLALVRTLIDPGL